MGLEPTALEKSSGRINQILAEHIRLVEGQLDFFHRILVEHGQDMTDSKQYQELLNRLELLQEQVRRVSQVESAVNGETETGLA